MANVPNDQLVLMAAIQLNNTTLNVDGHLTSFTNGATGDIIGILMSLANGSRLNLSGALVAVFLNSSFTLTGRLACGFWLRDEQGEYYGYVRHGCWV